MAPIWYFYIFLFRNGASLNENLAKFAFAVPLKKMHFNKMVFPFNSLYLLNGLRYGPGIDLE